MLFFLDRDNGQSDLGADAGFPQALACQGFGHFDDKQVDPFSDEDQFPLLQVGNDRFRPDGGIAQDEIGTGAMDGLYIAFMGDPADAFRFLRVCC